ncbi:FimV/HubP family polar landmark protein [Hydrocarboniphaga sp.]|uniref:FimV/HubP family polar landmark protein n=1 Tax=Hydrocarboniphaga sp. TaxID=2033016 RepID=UPI003D0A181A
MLQRLAIGTALFAGVFCTAAWSLGLGDIQVSSRLNQPLSATIPLTSLSEDDLDSLRVQLASPADFEKAGIERSDYLSSLKFSVSGSKVRISSGDIAREPYIALLVEARAGGSRVLRGYTVLLDLPAAASAGQPSAAATEQPEAPAAASAEPLSDAAAAESARQQQPKTYGPIRSGQTFWSVATKLRPDPALVSQDQTMLALYTANPQAFLGGINGLLIGSTLQVPSVEQMRAVPELEARRRVQALRAASVAPGTAVAQAPAKPAVAVAPQAPPAAPAVEAETPIAAAPADAAVTPPVETRIETAVQTPAETPVETSVEAATASPTNEAPPAAVDVTVPPPDNAVSQAAAAPAVAEAPAPPAVPAPLPPSNPDLLSLPLLMPALLLLALLALLLLWSRRRKAKAAVAAASVTAPVAATAAVAAAASESEPPPVEAVVGEPADPAAVPVAPPPVVDILSEAPPADSQVPPPEHDEAQPVEIDLAGGAETLPPAYDQLQPLDPVAEADFHLSYGLYDEAVRGLIEAIALEPDRNDLQLKLAETYFAAGRSADFEALAASLQPRLGAAEWSRLVFMGSQLCPESPLFRDPEAERPVEASRGHHIEFTLEPVADLPPPVAPAPSDNGNRVEFELNTFDGGAPVDVASWHSPTPAQTPMQTQWQPPSAPAVLDLADPGAIEFDALPEIDPNDIDLFEPEPEVDIATDDEVGTKLDLARAYLDMGDNQMARDLLAEVAVQGTAAQQADAEALLRRLPA